MERTVSPEERIRRAEEIYLKRRQEYLNQNKRYINSNRKLDQHCNIKKRIIKKIWTQIGMCLILYFILNYLINSNYFFSEKMRGKINEYMNYDINFEKLYNSINNSILTTLVKKRDNYDQEIQYDQENIQEDNNTESKENTDYDENILNEEAIGGAEEEQVIENNLTQEEKDADYIKKNYGIIWPVEGTITSRYGIRTPTDIVTANHYGLDIGANIGADIIAAMDGTVTLVSNYGDYGKHLEIGNNEVSTLYAHCNEVYVSEGENVIKGQKIAEVGQTRKSNRTTFTF